MIELPEPRDCVRQASEDAQDPFTKSWLFMDERGIWERNARELLEVFRRRQENPETFRKDATTEMVRNEIAGMLRLSALTARLNEERRKGGAPAAG